MQDPNVTSRIFTAVPVTEQFRTVATAYRMSLGSLPGTRWVPEANYHITLFFLGEVENSRLPELKESLQKLASMCTPFELVFDGFHAAGHPSHPSMIWGRYHRHPSFASLYSSLANVCLPFMQSPANQFPDPVPHVTLARTSRHGVFRQLPVTMLDAGPINIDRLALWRTHRHPKGVTYEELAVWPF